MPSTCDIVDTFPAFLAYWAKVEDKSLDDQVEGWVTDYMSLWPELLTRQIEDYSSQNLDWRQIARERVFPYLAERLPAMQQARQNLLKSAVSVYSRAQRVLSFESKAVFVIYVGIGCGAGWVTSFQGSPAILFGLENIAECGWSSPEAIKGIIAHETGHLVHDHWRAQQGKTAGTGSWWQLYEEGFAQYCESLILDREAPHQAASNHDDWLDWCQSHKNWLAAEFLRLADAGEPASPFFGSWFDICGKSETGYFLGYETLKELVKRLGLREVALLENAEAYLRPILEQMAKDNG